MNLGTKGTSSRSGQGLPDRLQRLARRVRAATRSTALRLQILNLDNPSITTLGDNGTEGIAVRCAMSGCEGYRGSRNTR